MSPSSLFFSPMRGELPHFPQQRNEADRSAYCLVMHHSGGVTWRRCTGPGELRSGQVGSWNGLALDRVWIWVGLLIRERLLTWSWCAPHLRSLFCSVSPELDEAEIALGWYRFLLRTDKNISDVRYIFDRFSCKTPEYMWCWLLGPEQLPRDCAEGNSLSTNSFARRNRFFPLFLERFYAASSISKGAYAAALATAVNWAY